LNKISPRRYFRSLTKRLEPLHRCVALGRGARLLDEGEHLTQAIGVDRQQQHVQQERLDVAGEHAEAGEERATDHVGNAQRHHRLGQQGGDEEDRADQREHGGNVQVGQNHVQQKIQDAVSREVVGVQAQLGEHPCNPQVVRRRVENAIHHGRQAYAAEYHRVP